MSAHFKRHQHGVRNQHEHLRSAVVFVVWHDAARRDRCGIASEYCCNRELHEYALYLDLENIEQLDRIQRTSDPATATV
jgi:hypothetical protein